jgi:hypothetical protein
MTGIYILQTQDEYRVTYSEYYYNLFGKFNDDMSKYEPVKEEFKSAFSKCFPFKTSDAALQFAQRLSMSIPETDDGIMFIKEYKEYTFEELCNG